MTTRGAPRLTHCWRGHSLTDLANVVIYASGRQCRACRRINGREFMREKSRRLSRASTPTAAATPTPTTTEHHHV